MVLGWVSCLLLGEESQGEQVLGAQCGEVGGGSGGLSVLGEQPVAPPGTEALGPSRPVDEQKRRFRRLRNLAFVFS